MADAMLIDEVAKKRVKRKREKQIFEGLTAEEKDSKLKTLNEEVETLFKYFNEILSCDLGLGGLDLGNVSSSSSNLNAMIAMLLEEKRWSYSKVVGMIYERLKSECDVTIASVKSSVLFVGQRMAYGVPNADVDVLEDETESCLWCWETRDVKLLPHSVRGALKVRRICRKKINERITAILAVIRLLQNVEDNPTFNHDMMKATERLGKVLAEADIRLLVENLIQKNDSEMVEKEVKKKGTALIKELEKNKREAEKEKKRMDRELQKEILQSEREKKRLQQEAEKDEKRREREESEMKKLLKRKQEEVEREQRRREKEELELKKQQSIQKQASIMERFLKKSKISVTPQNDDTPTAASDSKLNSSGTVVDSVSVLMDSTLQKQDEIDMEEIRKMHANSWRRVGHSIRSNNKQHWGLRRKPKTELVKELKLTSCKGPSRDDDMCIDNLVDGWEQTRDDDKTCCTLTCASPVTRKCLRRKQLFQFDKSHRPAFYGIWPKKSCVIGPRHPLKMDPDLDYDVDSDEEWEEEDPGESLSDSEKEEEEVLDEGSVKVDDEEESDDGFFVPDGYLSENEGVDTDRNSTPSCKPEVESEEVLPWIHQQKYLHKLTEHALRKNQPLIIVNLMHEKTQLSCEELTGASKAEQICLQALCIQVFPGGSPVEVPSDDNWQEENQEASRGNAVATANVVAILDSDLPKVVSVIQSYSQGINRVLESLQQTFPEIPKSHLRNKVREISEFVDNRWKVKKDVLNKLGMSGSPEKSGGRTKSIATFFSKRCLPPSAQVNPCESSPESLKPGSSNQQCQQPECTENM